MSARCTNKFAPQRVVLRHNAIARLDGRINRQDLGALLVSQTEFQDHEVDGHQPAGGCIKKAV